VNLASHRGLAGMREMIDGRTPGGPWRLRAGAYIQGSTTQIDVTGDVRTAYRDRYEFTPYIGASFLGHIELGFHWPFPQLEYYKNVIHDPQAPVNDPWPRLTDHGYPGGGGNFSFSAKGGWTLGPVSLAAYVNAQSNSGSRLMTHKEDSFGEAGGAGTVSIADGLACIHLNLSGCHLETRHLGWEFRFRTGFSFVVAHSERFVARSFVYGEGRESEGSRGCDYYLGAGVQFQFGEHFQLEVTGDGRLVADQLQQPFRDSGTYSVAAGAGYLY